MSDDGAVGPEDDCAESGHCFDVEFPDTPGDPPVSVYCDWCGKVWKVEREFDAPGDA